MPKLAKWTKSPARYLAACACALIVAGSPAIAQNPNANPNANNSNNGNPVHGDPCAAFSGGFIINNGLANVCGSGPSGDNDITTTGFVLDGDDVLGNGSLDLESLSPGAFTQTIQLGGNNSAAALIVNSPETEVFQTQIGWYNHSQVGVIGGGRNSIFVTQNGNSFSSDIYLLNSKGTTVNNYQSPGQSELKSLVVVNGKPGTIINMN